MTDGGDARAGERVEIGVERGAWLAGVDGGPREAIRRLGLALGLDAMGFASAEPTVRTRFLREWLDRGYGGEMHYLARRAEERMDPRRVLPGARSLIVGALALPATQVGAPSSLAEPRERDSRPGPSAAVGPEGGPAARETSAPWGRVARYAGGDDYHEVLLERLRAVEAALPVVVGHAVASRSWVDTGPIAEKAAAEAAGLGWIAKNTCLIHPELGSHLMLGVIVCDLALPPDPPQSDRCGSCRACLDVCPTDAFAEPYVLDATRCLAYTTIELRDAIPETLREAQGDHVFGCDDCQDVCPWNRSRPRRPLADPLGLRARLAPREAWRAPTLAALLALDEARFAEASRGTALRRSRLRGLLRNALVAAGNAGDPALREPVARHLELEDPLLREHARWALEQIDRVSAMAPACAPSDGR